MKTLPEKVVYFDMIRAFAIVAVVVTHVLMGVQYRVTTSDTIAWWTLNIYTVFARPAVPLFIMVSGALLLDARKTEDAVTFFRKRALRVFVPFALWSIFYLLLRKYVQHEEMSWPDFIVKLITAPVYLHLWFVYTLLGVYLITPILRILTRRINSPTMSRLLMVWFTLFTVCPFFARIIHYEYPVRLFAFLGCVGYFMLGFHLHTQPAPFNSSKKNLFAAFVVGLATCWVNAWAPEKRDLWNNSLTPHIVLMSTFIFGFFRSSWTHLSRSVLTNWWVNILRDYSFGIYFIHIIVLEALASGKLSFTFNALIFHPLLAIPLVATVTLLISLALLWVMRKIPIVKLLAP